MCWYQTWVISILWAKLFRVKKGGILRDMGYALQSASTLWGVLGNEILQNLIISIKPSRMTAAWVFPPRPRPLTKPAPVATMFWGWKKHQELSERRIKFCAGSNLKKPELKACTKWFSYIFFFQQKKTSTGNRNEKHDQV